MGSIDDYVSGLDAADASAVSAAYALARELVPDAVQDTKYGMPCLAVGGKGLMSVMVTRKHLGVYPFSGSAVAAVGSVSGLIGTTKGSMHFPLGEEIPAESVQAIIAARLAEIA